MDELIREIDEALRAELWRIALFSALALPDICAALESEDGQTDGKRYKAWVDHWLDDQYSKVDGNELYKIRCSYLHQGRTSGKQYERIVFTLPSNGNVFHNNIILGALNLDLVTFCRDLMKAVRTWQDARSDTDGYLKNRESLVQLYPEGMPPYIVGFPIIS